jgi:hypothetical protein
LQRAFSLDVLMVPSFALAISTVGECLTCGGFSLGETICLGSFKFIADYFGGLSLSPRRSNSGVAFMDSTRSRTLADVSYAALQVYRIVNVALNREYSPRIVFIFFQGRKDLYHV